MKVARFTESGHTRLGVVTGDHVADVGHVDPSLPDDLGVLLAIGALSRVADLAANAPLIALADVVLEAPIAQPPTFSRSGSTTPPTWPSRACRTRPSGRVQQADHVCHRPVGPDRGADRRTDWVDYEGELGVVIGQRCRSVKAADAPDVVAGYLVVNDVSVRDWQRATPTMTMGKSWDTHGPIGPWLVTTDEITDPHDLRIRTWVDDDLRQDASTSQMINNCWELIEHISTAFTLLPGTIIATGTPAGVGFVMDPPRCLSPGSTVRIEIESIGTIENPVIAQP